MKNRKMAMILTGAMMLGMAMAYADTTPASAPTAQTASTSSTSKKHTGKHHKKTGAKKTTAPAANATPKS